MYVERSSDGFRACFQEAPGFLHAALFGWLTDVQRRRLREPLPPSVSLLGMAMFAVGSGVVVASSSLESTWRSFAWAGPGRLGVVLMGLPTLVVVERWLWRRLGPPSLVLAVARGRVSVHRSGRLLVEAALASCELRCDQNLLGLIVDGRLYHWSTCSTHRELYELVERFGAARSAFGGPADVPKELGTVVATSRVPPATKKQTVT